MDKFTYHTKSAITGPMPFYEFLGNNSALLEIERSQLLEDIFRALGIADKAGYITHLSANAPEVRLPTYLIPPIGQSLR
jgi:hypothetical protein